MGRYQDNRSFEDDVRRVAEALFELPPGDCKSEMYTKGKRQIEIDGVARCRNIVQLIMATTSTKLDKVKEDVEKLNIAGSIEVRKGNTTKCWIIVNKIPEAPHVTYSKENNVELLTFQQFRERFFDGRAYLSLRNNLSFGSARDLKTGSISIPVDEYIEPPIKDLDKNENIILSDIISRLIEGKTVIMLGPFGSGKSLSMREIWFDLRKKYFSNSLELVPVALNLREHWGAQYADEILRRHAHSIGYKRESDLTVAWRAGILILLIDGFDEMASQGLVNLENINVLKQIRLNSLIGVRDLIAKSQNGVGVLISGRDHYFDNYDELKNALGLQGMDISRVYLDEFDDKRAEEYLKKKNIKTALPDWLPRKALLLGYLAQKDLLKDVLSIDGSKGQARAWYEFLKLISFRESQHDRSAMDADTIQHVLENLAIQVRSTSSGIGPITASMLAQAYISETGQTPGDAVLMQLQRLPGLTERDAEPGNRSFVDQDLLNTLQGTAISRQLIKGIINPRKNKCVVYFDDTRWYEPLSSLGCSVSIIWLREKGWSLETLINVIRQYSSSQLGADLLQIAICWAMEDENPVDLHGIELSNIHIANIDLDEVAIKGLYIQDSLIDNVVIGCFANDSDITISNSLITKVSGAGSKEHLQKTIHFLNKVDVSEWDNLQTTDAIVRLKTDDSVKALLACLKKLFRQRGAGRVVGAFRRGVPPSIQTFIDPVLQILIQEDIAWRLKDVYHPVRRQARRVNQILDNPCASTDPIIEKVKILSS